MSARPLVEVYPASMVESRRPNLLEPAYGVEEKTGERRRADGIVALKEKATIYTHEWLTPLLYRFDEASGALMVVEMLRPAPYAAYILESVGGERVRKQTSAGIVYVLTKPYYLGIGEAYSGLTREKLRAGLTLSGVRVQVRDPAKLVIELWRRSGSLDPGELVYELKRLFRRSAQKLLPETSVEDLLAKPADLEEKVSEALSPLLEQYGIQLLEVDVKPVVSDEVYDYYFWHMVNELPVDYTYLVKLLSKLPTPVYEHTPPAVSLLVASIVARRDPKLGELILRLLREEVLGRLEEREGSRSEG